ncbi:MAG: M67 family metallopeptidase [Chloroflexi bacterium]|nr:M67 family metallopeptidase [Chloroflexota bacterium]
MTADEPVTVDISRSLVDEMIAHAREDLPNEACGIVHARDGTPVSVHRVTNVAASPYRFEMHGIEQMQLEQSRDDAGETLFAIYHSHVASPAYPSQTDVRMAFFPPGEVDQTPAYPEALYILVSLAEDPPPVHAYHIREGGVIEEQPIAIV